MRCLPDSRGQRSAASASVEIQRKAKRKRYAIVSSALPVVGELRLTDLPLLLRPLGGLAERLLFANAQEILDEEARVLAAFLQERA